MEQLSDLLLKTLANASLPNEIWLPIPDYPKYLISNRYRIFSLTSGTILPTLNGKVRLSRHNVKTTYSVTDIYNTTWSIYLFGGPQVKDSINWDIITPNN